MEEAKIVITLTGEGNVTVEGYSVSNVEQLVMCHAMVKETANQLGVSFDIVLGLMLKANEQWEKDQETGILS